MDLELEGKTALVTGASRGIGRAIARQLALEGVDVAICARTEAPLQTAAAELGQETGRRVLPVVADTSDGESIQLMARTVLAAFGHVDILVINAARAGGAFSQALADVPIEEMRIDFETKVLGYLLCARALAPGMKERGWGRIINIDGGAARGGTGITTSVRNIAVVALSHALARQLGPHGINVNLVHPGTTRTELLRGRLEADAKAHGITLEEEEKRVTAQSTTRRIVEPSEIADLVAFLASPRSLAVVGETIAASGSVSAGVYP